MLKRKKIIDNLGAIYLGVFYVRQLHCSLGRVPKARNASSLLHGDRFSIRTQLDRSFLGMSEGDAVWSGSKSPREKDLP